MSVRKAMARGTVVLLLAGAFIVAASNGAVAADGPGAEGELVAGTPDGVTMWMTDCYVSSMEPQPGTWNGEVVHPGRRYGCNVRIDVSPQYEEEHGPYTVPMSLITSTATFRALGAPYVGVGTPVCAAGESPHYVGIASAGAGGTYGSHFGGFHENFYDTACLLEINSGPRPNPDDSLPPVSEPTHEAEKPEGELMPESTAMNSSDAVSEFSTPRSVPESVQTGVGADSSVAPTGSPVLGYLSLAVSLALFIAARVHRRQTL